MIEVNITPKRPVISINVEDEKDTIEVGIGAPHSGTDFPIYTGPTLVKPEPYYYQILETDKKALKENITVLPIPYFEMSNPSGGTTIYIGD